jgi:hypothetical protein
MKTEPGVTAKTEEHLLGCSSGRKKRGTGELIFEERHIAAAKNRGGRMEDDMFDFLLQSRIPAFAEEFDLGEFGHGQVENDLI